MKKLMTYGDFCDLQILESNEHVITATPENDNVKITEIRPDGIVAEIDNEETIIIPKEEEQ